MKKLLNLSWFLFLLMCLASCTVKISLSGASIHPDVKTISIHYFKNNAPLVKAGLSQELTEAVRERFQTQTNLNLVNSGGDMDISGEITAYNTSPIAIQGNQTAAMNRLTITINVRFTNKYNPSSDFESSFSRYQDYPSSQSLSSVEGTIITQINEYLVDDIFNKTVVNW